MYRSRRANVVNKIEYKICIFIYEMALTPPISFTDIDIGDILYEIAADNREYGPILVIFSRGEAGFIGVELNEEDDEVLITEYSDATVHYTRTGSMNLNAGLMTLIMQIQ